MTLRAVAGGVQVGFVCGPGIPKFSDISLVNSADKVTHPISHVQYSHVKATDAIVVPIPAVDRNQHIAVDVALAGGREHGFPIYVATFTYNSLPRTKPRRVPGSRC